MIHARQSDCSGLTAQARRLLGSFLAGAVLVLAACGDDGPANPSDLYVGQLGSMQVVLEVPLRLGDGQLLQQLDWKSSGEWSLTESISYRGLLGDGSSFGSVGEPSGYALAYASVIEQLNTSEGLSLFAAADSLLPECDSIQSRVTFTLHDDARGTSTTWIRCASGSLSNLSPAGAGPDAQASRVVVATLLAREATLGRTWRSKYLGSVPFGTLDRGGDSGSPITTPVTFIDNTGFTAFWARHAPGRAPPAVDFNEDMVVVGLVGRRREAGDSVEIRRILQVEEGTVTEVFERTPGNFCSPVARTHVPFHIVVAPRTPIPHLFADIRVELVPCGG